MTGSNSTKRDLINWGIPEGNIAVISYGLEKSPLKKVSLKDKKDTLIYLGALAKDKGIEEVLRIFAQINSKRPGFIYWVVGKGEEHYTEYLKVKSHKLGLKKNIRFWGYLEESKKYQLLARAHLLINPSFREGWGLVVMEAASVGTPTVGYDVPGLRDSIVNNKTGVLSNRNPQSLAEEALKLINDKAKYQRLRKNCLSWSKKFSWEKSSKESLKLIEKLVRT